MQLDIFGNEVPLSYATDRSTGKTRTYKAKFRNTYGYKEGYRCKNCRYFKSFYYNDKHYFKCEKLGITNSEATDIRKKDVACWLYESEVVDNALRDTENGL